MCQILPSKKVKYLLTKTNVKLSIDNKQRVDEASNIGNSTSLNSSNLLNVTHSQNDLLRSNFQNMPIYETQEDLETTKKNLTSLTVDVGDEYDYSQITNRLSTNDKAIIMNREKVVFFQEKDPLAGAEKKIEDAYEANRMDQSENIIFPSYTEYTMGMISPHYSKNNLEDNEKASTNNRTEETPLKIKHKSQEYESKTHREYRRTHTIPTLVPLKYK